jgi:hypothetical protein
MSIDVSAELRMAPTAESYQSPRMIGTALGQALKISPSPSRSGYLLQPPSAIEDAD